MNIITVDNELFILSSELTALVLDVIRILFPLKDVDKVLAASNGRLVLDQPGFLDWVNMTNTILLEIKHDPKKRLLHRVHEVLRDHPTYRFLLEDITKALSEAGRPNVPGPSIFDPENVLLRSVANSATAGDDELPLDFVSRVIEQVVPQRFAVVFSQACRSRDEINMVVKSRLASLDDTAYRPDNDGLIQSHIGSLLVPAEESASDLQRVHQLLASSSFTNDFYHAITPMPTPSPPASVDGIYFHSIDLDGYSHYPATREAKTYPPPCSLSVESLPTWSSWACSSSTSPSSSSSASSNHYRTQEYPFQGSGNYYRDRSSAAKSRRTRKSKAKQTLPPTPATEQGGTSSTSSQTGANIREGLGASPANAQALPQDAGVGEQGASCPILAPQRIWQYGPLFNAACRFGVLSDSMPVPDANAHMSARGAQSSSEALWLQQGPLPPPMETMGAPATLASLLREQLPYLPDYPLPQIEHEGDQQAVQYPSDSCAGSRVSSDLPHCMPSGLTEGLNVGHNPQARPSCLARYDTPDRLTSGIVQRGLPMHHESMVQASGAGLSTKRKATTQDDDTSNPKKIRKRSSHPPFGGNKPTSNAKRDKRCSSNHPGEF